MTVILAGGSGGLGSVAARIFHQDGFELVISYKSNRDRAERVEHLGQIVQADLTIAEDRTRLLDAAPNLYGVVVFAGDATRGLELEQACRHSFEVNFLGPILFAREATDRMRASNVAGSIVLVSTMQAVSLWEGSTAYACQKAALIHGARILAKEARATRVNVVCPGVNQAGMAEASIAQGKYSRYLDQGLIPRYGRAEDVARAIGLFLQPDNYITGQVLTVDGGLTL